MATAGSNDTKQIVRENPTLRDSPAFDPVDDAKTLRKAMKGIGTDEKALINVLCRRTDAQRQQIATEFKTSFGKDLVADLKSETSGKFEDLLVALMTPRYDYLAQRVKTAVKGLGTTEDDLIDVLCPCSNSEIKKIQEVYQSLYGTALEADVKSDTSGYFRRLLVSLCASARNEDTAIDLFKVQQDASDLNKAGLQKMGTDESVFNEIFATRSYSHLRAVFSAYEELTGEPIEITVDGEFSGYIKKSLLAIVKCAYNRPAYFAQRLNDSMRGIRTNNSALIFYIVSRAEIDLETIKAEYQQMYSKSLADDISSNTSGDYKKALIVLVN